MTRLKAQQAAIMASLDLGPAHLPDDVFAGPRATVLRGMKVYANTISHGRLVALEDTFPRTLDLMGHDRFNALSRGFIETAGACAMPTSQIGRHFPGHLAAEGEAEDTVALARFEWSWLISYHAADAPAIALSDLAGIAEAALLDIAVALHPAAQVMQADPAVTALIGAEVPGLAHAAAILLTRPEAQVLVAPATTAMAELAQHLHQPITICNLLTAASEPSGRNAVTPETVLPVLIALIEAGALVRRQQGN